MNTPIDTHKPCTFKDQKIKNKELHPLAYSSACVYVPPRKELQRNVRSQPVFINLLPRVLRWVRKIRQKHQAASQEDLTLLFGDGGTDTGDLLKEEIPTQVLKPQTVKNC